MADPFQFDLVSPERLLMSEQASEVVVPGSEGQFTVLSGHAPVMTTLRPGIVEVTLAAGRRERIFVRGGFADVNNGGLTILAEQATPMAELDSDVLSDQIKAADEVVAAAKDETARTEAVLVRDQLKDVQAQLGRGGGSATH